MALMQRRSSMQNRATHLTAGIAAILLSSTAMTPTDALADNNKTKTPIKHLIVLIGENRTFDRIFATYRPMSGQSIANLLSKRIILKSGQPGLNFMRSQQYLINPPFPATYFIDASVTAGKTVYQQSPLAPTFPVPNTASVPPAPGGLDLGQAPPCWGRRHAGRQTRICCELWLRQRFSDRHGQQYGGGGHGRGGGSPRRGRRHPRWQTRLCRECWLQQRFGDRHRQQHCGGHDPGGVCPR
jgi:hypothetical protein